MKARGEPRRDFLLRGENGGAEKRFSVVALDSRAEKYLVEAGEFNYRELRGESKEFISIKGEARRGCGDEISFR